MTFFLFCPGTPAADLRLSFGGRPLASGASLAAAGVTEESTLEALARLAGGGKKRKKKVNLKKTVNRSSLPDGRTGHLPARFLTALLSCSLLPS